MIRTQTSDRTVEGNLTGDVIAMGIDAGAMEHIMSILTDLYSDPELACLREYSTNAFDAHVAAGVTAPIEVSLPSALSPFLRIRDHGIGLSHDDIAAIYSRYGASTKQETNEQVGMLGLGCKSALTYCDQFTLTSVKDGRCVQVAISRTETGSGTMTVVSDEPTADPPGTEVCIPAKRHHEFGPKAREFFSYWTPGTVLVDGAQPEPFDYTVKVSDAIWATGSPYYDHSDVVIMGNVAYPAKLDKGTLRARLVARVDIGAVDFTPSREQLHYTDRTRATLESVMEDFNANRESAIQRSLDAQDIEPWQAIYHAHLSAQALDTPLGGLNLTYKGKALPPNLKVDQAALDRFSKRSDGDESVHDPRWIVAFGDTWRVGQHALQSELSATELANPAWVYGFDRTKWTPTCRRKLDLWAEQNNVPIPAVWVIARGGKGDLPTEWINPDRMHDFADIFATKLPRKQRTQGGTPVGAYDGISNGHFARKSIELDELDDETQVLWEPSDSLLARDRDLETLLDNLDPSEYVVVYLPTTRQSKFLRLRPDARRLRTVLSERIQARIDALTDDEALQLRMRRVSWADNRNGLGHLVEVLGDGKDIEDPEVVRYLEVRTLAEKPALRALEAAIQWAQDNGLAVDEKRVSGLDGLPPNPVHAYPLLRRGWSRHGDEHLVEYINAVYQRRTSTKED